MPRRKSNARGVKRYDSGGSVSDSGTSSGSSSGGVGSYYNMMSQLRGNLGGSRESPYANPQGGNAYFSKGGRVGAKAKAKRKR